MRLAWTKSKLPLSVAIRWGLSEPSSHFLVVFNDDLMFQSNLLGTGLDYYPYFVSKEAQVVHELIIPLDRAIEDQVYASIMMNFSHRYYDFGALAYFTWRGLLRKFLRIPLPTKNRWGHKNALLCVGVAKCLDVEGVPPWLRSVVRQVPDLEMITPEDLYQRIIGAKPAEVAPGIV